MQRIITLNDDKFEYDDKKTDDKFEYDACTHKCKSLK